LFDQLDFEGFHRDEVPRLLALHGALAAKAAGDLKPIAFRLPDGRAWTYAVEGGRVAVTPGDEGAATVAALDEAAWSDFVNEAHTCFGLLYAGLAVDGWIPVDPETLETRFADVYAVGDVTSVGTPKAGVFAEGQAAVVARRIVERVRTGAASSAYDGRGVCYLEFGDDEVARVEVTFLSGQAPTGRFEAASAALAADKGEFGSSRVLRWFDRAWP